MAKIGRLGILAFGDSPEAAIAAATSRYAGFHDFAQSMRLPLDSVITAGDAALVRRAASTVAALALAVAGFGLLMIPFSYWLSTGFKRAVVRLSSDYRAEKFLAPIDKPLAQAVSGNFDLTSEEQHRIANLLRVLATQLQPMLKELRLFFGADVPATAR